MTLRRAMKGVVGSYFFIVVFSLIIGILFPNKILPLSSYTAIFLGIIFFLSSLEINLEGIKEYLSDKWMLIVVNLFMLIALPALVYFVSINTFPDMAIALLILAAMPSGMTTPLLSDIVGGKPGLALLFVISTSILAPITIPLVIKYLDGASITLGFYEGFISIAQVVLVPFLIAQVIKKFSKKLIKKVAFSFESISILMLSLIIMSVVSKQADAIIDGLKGGVITTYLIVLFIFFIILHVIGYFTVFWRERKDRITITVSLTYMNTTLAIYIVDKFFLDPNIILPVILAVIPWVVLLIPFKLEMKKLSLSSPQK